MDALTRPQILRALEALANALPPKPRVELVVVGGAALVLAFNAREATKDVDGFAVLPTQQAMVRKASHQVALRLNLPEDWLNDGAKGYVEGVSPGPTLLESPNLIVRTVSVAQLLAMKLAAWRDSVDIEDARLLLKQMNSSREQVWSEIRPFLVPGRELKSRLAFDDLWDSLNEPPRSH